MKRLLYYNIMFMTNIAIIVIIYCYYYFFFMKLNILEPYKICTVSNRDNNDAYCV